MFQHELGPGIHNKKAPRGYERLLWVVNRASMDDQFPLLRSFIGLKVQEINAREVDSEGFGFASHPLIKAFGHQNFSSEVGDGQNRARVGAFF